MISALSPVTTGSSRAGDLAAFWHDYDNLWKAGNAVAAKALPAGEPQSQTPQLRNNAIDAPTRSAPMWLVGSAGARSSPNRSSNNHKSAKERPNQDGQAEVPRWDRMLPEEFPAIEAISGNDPLAHPMSVDRAYQRPVGDNLHASGRAPQVSELTSAVSTGNTVLKSFGRLADRQRAQASRCFVDVPKALAHIWPATLPLAAAA